MERTRANHVRKALEELKIDTSIPPIKAETKSIMYLSEFTIQ
jgi:hypothetical protein